MWLFITIVCILTTLHAYVSKHESQVSLFSLLSVLSLLMFILRYRINSKHDSEK